MTVAVDMRTLLDRKIFSSRTNGQVAARRVTGLIIKRLWAKPKPECGTPPLGLSLSLSLKVGATNLNRNY